MMVFEHKQLPAIPENEHKGISQFLPKEWILNYYPNQTDVAMHCGMNTYYYDILQNKVTTV